MKTPELQPKISNLETLENELSLTKQELEEFRKLPKEEQEKQKSEKLAKLSDLQNKLDQAIQEAIKTGNIEEAKNLKEQIEKEIKDLEEQMEATISPEVVEKVKEFYLHYFKLDKEKREKKNYKLRAEVLKFYLLPEIFGESRLNLKQLAEKNKVSDARVQQLQYTVYRELGLYFMRNGIIKPQSDIGKVMQDLMILLKKTEKDK